MCCQNTHAFVPWLYNWTNEIASYVYKVDRSRINLSDNISPYKYLRIFHNNFNNTLFQAVYNIHLHFYNYATNQLRFYIHVHVHVPRLGRYIIYKRWSLRPSVM